MLGQEPAQLDGFEHRGHASGNRHRATPPGTGTSGTGLAQTGCDWKQRGANTQPGGRSASPGTAIPCEQYHRVERGHGHFSRAFALPEAVDVDAVTADLKDGILTVTMPKAAGRGTRRVDVT